MEHNFNDIESVSPPDIPEEISNAYRKRRLVSGLSIAALILTVFEILWFIYLAKSGLEIRDQRYPEDFAQGLRVHATLIWLLSLGLIIFSAITLYLAIRQVRQDRSSRPSYCILIAITGIGVNLLIFLLSLSVIGSLNKFLA